MYLRTASTQLARNGESYATLSLSCFSGDTPVWGGYYDSLGDDIRRLDEYVNYGSGASYITDIVDYSPAITYGYTTVTVQVMCISLSNFSNSKTVYANALVDSGTHLALGIADCGSGWYAVNSSLYFNSLDSTVLTSSPYNSSTRYWIARGWIGTAGKTMTIALHCVQSAVLDAVRVYTNSDAAGGWWSGASATCPVGFTFLTGGTYNNGDGQAITIDPRLDNRTLQSLSGGGSGSTVTTVVCLPTSSPQLALTGTPYPDLTSTAARWTFTVTDPASAGGYSISTTCQLRKIVASVPWPVIYDFQPCSSPVTESSLAEGGYELTLTAMTSDGRSDTEWWHVIIDHTIPVVTFADPPGLAHKTTTVNVSAQVSDVLSLVTGLTCALDGAVAAPCGQGQYVYSGTDPGCLNGCTNLLGAQQFDYTGMADGSHVLHVTVTDSHTNTHTYDLPFKVDTVTPTVTQTAPSARFTVATSVKVAWTGQDATSGVASYALQWQRAPYNGEMGSWSAPLTGITASSRTFTGLAPGGTYCYQVQATDHAANLSGWTSARCTAIPLDDRALAESAGWTAVKPAGYFKGTAMVTSKRGQTLTATGVNTRRVAVVAKTCPSCGVVGVYVAGVKIGEMNLKAATTGRKVTMLPPFAMREGVKVVLKVLSTGKVVQIDALGLSQR